MKNIAIIPARSGSKGLKDKNIKMLAGFPLMFYSIKAALQSDLFNEVMVSTDSAQYAAVAKQHGAKVPFLRSAEQSGDYAGSWEVVSEVLNKYNEKGIRFDTVCLLQPTSPLRDYNDIIKGYHILENKKCEAVTSVCAMDHSPLWSMILPEDGSMKEFRAHMESVPRQSLQQYYRLNGAVYIRKIRYEKDNIKILDQNEYALIMDRKKSIDIDTADDFELAEYYMHSKKVFS